MFKWTRSGPSTRGARLSSSVPPPAYNIDLRCGRLAHQFCSIRRIVLHVVVVGRRWQLGRQRCHSKVLSTLVNWNRLLCDFDIRSAIGWLLGCNFAIVPAKWSLSNMGTILKKDIRSWWGNCWERKWPVGFSKSDLEPFPSQLRWNGEDEMGKSFISIQPIVLRRIVFLFA